ncbi:MAG TPA: DUF2130 domain-containing protein [Chitinophagaceae bacterium]|nr:DUF2130 domain-containing protein [Chitinophagaceae bacterium]
MATEIKCPNCGHEFEPTDLIRDEIQKEVNSKAEEWKKKKEKELEESLRKNISSDFETKLRFAEQTNKDNEEKLKLARQKETDFLRKEQELKNKEAEIELTVQKQLQRDREKLTEDIRKIEEQKTANKETEYQLKIKELEKQRDDQKKLADEMKRKAEQGSMQTQGEVQELLLEEMLRAAFPFDLVTEVGKGVRGADCIQTVRNAFGQECGRIIFESKRTKDFGNDWIDKLKADMRSQGADVAVIVTQALPRDMSSFGEKEGVWICSFAEAKAVVAMLRDAVIKIFNAAKSQDNKGDKMHLLYDYLTSREFAEQWQAIREGFMSMKLSIQRERDAMEKLWKAREKQLEKVLLSAAHVRGSIEGISGTDVDLNLLEDSTDADE